MLNGDLFGATKYLAFIRADGLEMKALYRRCEKTVSFGVYAGRKKKGAATMFSTYLLFTAAEEEQ